MPLSDIFLYQSDANFLLNVNFAYFSYSHKSGNITREHWLTDILFHFANIIPYNWKVSLSNAVWFYKTFNFLLSNIFKLEQKYDTSLVVHNKKIGEFFILLAFQQLIFKFVPASEIPR